MTRIWLFAAFSLLLGSAPAALAQSPPCQFPLTYPGDLSSPESIAAWLAGRATAAGLPPELPVMASLVESNLQNLPAGDRDSMGFFQMRLATWNQGVYAGYPDRPELQIKWFLDQSVSARNALMLRGNRSQDDPADYGAWISESLRPTGANRNRYQDTLDNARRLIAAGRLLAGSWPFAGETPTTDAPRTDIAGWMASRAIAAGLPAELPIMAALVESGLQNLSSDGSSAGYFRMSEQIWSGLYPSFQTDPELQIKWFIDQARVVRALRIASGDGFFGQDPNKFGEWIADVERPAEQLRGRYQLKLEEARLLMQAGCATR